MPDPQAWAISYLAARHQQWSWADDGNVLTWSDDTTVAFREEIIFILEWLLPHGWPPFGALVSLLAACRGIVPWGTLEDTSGNWPATPAVEEGNESRQLMLAAFRQRQRQMLATVERGLGAIAALPVDLRTSLKAKATLAEIVFVQPAKGGGRTDFLQPVLDVLRSGVLTDAMLNDPGAPVSSGEQDWQRWHGAFAELTRESLEMRLRTGLDAVPRPVPLPLPAAVRVRQVLAELRADAEHAGLARLVRDFMAAIQLPRRLAEQDEMPVGGFADITNRGNPNRLLLSELAHDDLTLAVRIAMNEALYLRREPPAKQPPSTLAVLLDSGVRQWGVPRVLATAAALALVARSATHERCAIFRAHGSQLEPVDLLSKEGVVKHLGTLELHAHPGAALAAFCARLEEEEHAEAVLITHREAWTDPDFQRDLALAKCEALYVALVDRDGSFTLRRHPHGGAALCEAEVDINALFPEAPGKMKVPSLIDRTANPELPLILSARPFPLLIAVRGEVQKAIVLRGGGGACVMKDRRLLAWTGTTGRGARTVACNLPRGSTLWLGEHDDGALCVVKIQQGVGLACRVFAREGELLHSHDWQLPSIPIRVESRSDVIFIICTNHAEVRDMTTGELLDKTGVSRGNSHGRYFISKPMGGWCVLSWNGQKLQLDRLVLLGDVPREGILRVFNNHDSAGPCVLTYSGDVYDASGRRVMALGPLRAVVRISEDGRRLLVASKTDGTASLVDLPHRKQWPIRGTIHDADWIWSPQPPTWAVRSRVYRLALSDGHVCLQTSRNGWSRLESPTHQSVALRPMVDPPAATDDIREFTQLTLSGSQGFALKVVAWPDGRRAWLDDRGLLHLRCAKKELPEATIVLGSDGLAAWSTEGLFWGGLPFFIDDHPSAPWEKLWTLLREFTTPA